MCFSADSVPRELIRPECESSAERGAVKLKCAEVSGSEDILARSSYLNAVAVGLAAAAAAAAAVVLPACGNRAVETILRCPSPDSSVDAVFYWVHGGGAAGWAYFRVGLNRSQQQVDPDKYFFEMRHGYDVRMSWNSQTELEIEYPDKAVVQVKRDKADSPINGSRDVKGATVRIAYRPVATVSDYSISGGSKCVTQ
jgi:hypothetical protein